MDWFGLLIFLAIVGGTLVILILSGRWERRSQEVMDQDLIDLPHDPIDRAVTRREETNPLAQTRTVVGRTFPVGVKTQTATPPPETPEAPDATADTREPTPATDTGESEDAT